MVKSFTTPTKAVLDAHKSSSSNHSVLWGLLIGFGLIGTAMALGGSLLSFIDVPAIFIVFGGTFAATLMCFSGKDLIDVVKNLFYPSEVLSKDVRGICFEVVRLSNISKQRGPLFLEKELKAHKDNPFFLKALMMVVDGVEAQKIQDILTLEKQSLHIEHMKSANVLYKASEFAPAMGLIGTLIGLVQMLQKLNDPSTIGPSMAVAILTALYGALVSNLILGPLATKLEVNAELEQNILNLYITGALSMARHENPRETELRLSSLLPPEHKLIV